MVSGLALDLVLLVRTQSLALALSTVDAVYLNHVGGTCATCGSTGSNDDQVASFCQTVLQQVLVHEVEQTFLVGDHLNLLSVNADVPDDVRSHRTG